MRRILILASIITAFIFILGFKIHADEYDDITKQLNDLKNQLNSSQQATKNNEVNLANLNKQLNGIKYQVGLLQAQINQKQKEVKEGETALTYQKTILGQRTISYYKNLNKNSLSMLNILVSDNLSTSMQQFFFQKSLIDDDRRTILKVIAYIKELNDKKMNLEKENAKLLVIKQEVDKQSQFLSGEVAKSKAFESDLQGKIAVLSAKQQSIIAQRLGSLNIPHSAYTSQGGCSDDRDTDPGFSPRLAFFSYGVPNRVGLNQYGAKGRADAGQSFDTILHAYYNFDGYQSFSTTISVNDGNGVNTGNVIWSGSLDDYAKRIYEVPAGWPAESLKAQAVAARSYALAVTNNGANSICATESCQVFKTDPKGGAWDQAVNDTAGQAMIQGGQPVKAWFSSTHGGYVHSSGDIGWSPTSWTKNAVDTTSGSASSFDDLKNNAYDKESPWFYCDWGWRAQYNKTAWLKTDEVADIANVVMLVSRDSSTSEHLYQPDNPPPGTETWDQDRVKSELRSRGGNPYNNVNNVSVDWDSGSGRTTSVHVSGDAGDNSFDSTQFRNFFNIRAPANIYIAGSLFNIEKR